MKMERKMECPICKNKVLFVGVHDDEGNYHGLLGCEYENDPWSGLSYALHHESWGECPLCTDGAYSTMGGMLFDTAEDAISALSPQNEPLTLEQLRKMDEPTPVWWEKASCWCLCERGFIIAPNGNIYEFEETDGTFYRRPPEGDEST